MGYLNRMLWFFCHFTRVITHCKGTFWNLLTQQASLSSATIVHPNDISEGEDISLLLAQLRSSSEEVDVVTQKEIKISGHRGQIVELKLRILSESFTGKAVIVVIANVEHRVLFLQKENANRAYDVLWERIQKEIQIISS